MPATPSTTPTPCGQSRWRPTSSAGPCVCTCRPYRGPASASRARQRAGDRMAHRSDTVTMADVGARAGVTGRTVSNVLSGHPSVRAETRERVLRAVDELGYRLNTSARSLRTGRTGSITLATRELGIDYSAARAARIMVEAERHDWSVVIQQTGARRENELAILSGASRQHSDGLIFQP